MTNPTEPREAVEVTQADRDAAVAIGMEIDGGHPLLRLAGAVEVVSGLQDWHPIVQAFARHRLAHTPQQGEAKRPWCETCGKDVPEVLCPTCAKWWADNPPPTPQDDAERAGLVELVEGDIRIAVSNTLRQRGMSQEAAQSFIQHLFDDPCMKRALSALRTDQTLGDTTP